MIAKSDLFILIAATATLSFGIYRWNQNTQAVDAITIPASSRSVATSTELPQSSETVATATTTPVAQTPVAEEPVVPVAAIEVAEPVMVTEVVTEQPLYANHVVTSGESLSIIAYRYGTTVATLRELNGIRGSTIQVGQNIQYPAN